MRNIEKKLASEVGVQPAYIETMEHHGLCYFVWPESGVVGAQCACCHTIIWTDAMKDPVLGEVKPADIPSCGIEYKKYYDEKIIRFLGSIGVCPVCGNKKFDQYVNNVSFPRYADGTVFDDSSTDLEIIYEMPENIELWWQSP